MSGEINNREYRQKVLKELIMELHNGKSVEEVRERFQELIKDISTFEISQLEQKLIREGMAVEEVQRLCDVHAAVFKGSIEEIHSPKAFIETPGHPLNTFTLENEAVEKYIEERVEPHLNEYGKDASEGIINKLLEDFNLLWDLDRHYSRKENLLFPFLEKYGITAPPKVMWGVDDEIRGQLKDIRGKLIKRENKETLSLQISETLKKIKEMIFKEKSILFPMAAETLMEDEWIAIERESDDIGYCITGPSGKWIPERVNLEKKEEQLEDSHKGYVKFDTGLLSFKELNAILNMLPVDITFIDGDDIVKYFSQSKERIFPRTKAVLGRNVQNCHPPASVHIVNKMLEDFKSGEKDSEDFWIKMGGAYVYIRYFAVRDEKGSYIGTMEVTQNIKPIQEISGEKRLLEV